MARLRLLQTQSDGWGRSALGTLGRATTWAKDRHKHLIAFAGNVAVSLHRPNIRRASISLVAFIALGAWRALRSLWTLRPRRSLSSSHALQALRTLRTCRSLRPRVTLRTRVTTASRKSEGHSNKDKRKQLHGAALPSDVPIESFARGRRQAVQLSINTACPPVRQIKRGLCDLITGEHIDRHQGSTARRTYVSCVTPDFCRAVLPMIPTSKRREITSAEPTADQGSVRNTTVLIARRWMRCRRGKIHHGVRAQRRVPVSKFRLAYVI